VGDKWTLLIIRDLSAGPRRFVELQRVLPGISTEQLRSRLNRMVADGLLTRQRFREVPPRVDYDLTERAKDLMPVLGALARWGYDWAWGTPRPGERVDVRAVLRLAPGMLSPPPGLEGTMEAVLEPDRAEVPEARSFLAVSGGQVSVTERAPVATPAATVRGPETAWIAALGPQGDPSGLAVSGNRALADTVLDGLMRSAASAVAA